MIVLLVEDDVGIGRFVSHGLSARGLTVRWERTGREVQSLVTAGGIDLVILDLGLPDLDGIEICAAIRGAECGIPILMLTARSSLEDRLDGFSAGADDYLSKPFAFEELAARAEVLLRRSSNRMPDPVKLGSLRIDPSNHVASWQDCAIPLEPRAFALLLALANAKGAIVPREVLIDAIWGVGADITDNALDACASALRRRLAEAATTLQVTAYRRQGIALEFYST